VNLLIPLKDRLKKIFLDEMMSCMVRKNLLFLLLLLTLVLQRRAFPQKALRAKYQDWLEADDRIHVRTWSTSIELPLGEEWKGAFTAVLDSLSGATPNGSPPSTTDKDWLSHMDEERKSGTFQLSRELDDYEFTFEYSHSREPDYISRGYTIGLSRNLAEETLFLSAGFSFLDDRVDTSVPGGPGIGFVSRHTPEFFAGLRRVLSPTTTVALNLVYSRPEGYLGDPYKQVPYNQILFAGTPREITRLFLYPENRPGERHTHVVYSEMSHYLTGLNASIEGSYRFFADDAGVLGHTLVLAWFQRLNEKLILRPSMRLYRQSASDFYHASLDGTGIVPTNLPSEASRHYSSDYRLSHLQTTDIGVRLTWLVNDSTNLDVAFNRYEMKGLDSVTSQLLYPRAKIFTLGIQREF
jgi:hypothetical protein